MLDDVRAVVPAGFGLPDPIQELLSRKGPGVIVVYNAIFFTTRRVLNQDNRVADEWVLRP